MYIRLIQMSCPSCKNTYIAAKNRHMGCIEALSGIWDKRTLCGAIESGDKRVYNTVREMDYGRTCDIEVICAAAKAAWTDVMANHYNQYFTNETLVKFMQSAMSGKSVHSCEFVYTNYMRDVDITVARYKKLLMSAISSCSTVVIRWFEQTFGWWVQYIDENTAEFFECAVNTGDLTMMEYLWPIFDLEVHFRAMEHRYLHSALRIPRAFQFLMGKCNEFDFAVDPELKEQALWYPKYALHNIILLYRNNAEWGWHFAFAIEDEIAAAGPRNKLIYERIKGFAIEHGLHLNRKDEFLEKILALVGDFEVEEPLDIGKLMTHIDSMDMPEGKYIEVCQLMKKLYDAMKR